VREADETRRLGEDLLFAQEQTAWDSARSSFQKANLLYAAAQQDAAVVRHALAVRDQVLQALPAYSRSLARQRMPEGTGRQQVDRELLDRALHLWQEVHRLGQLLEN